MVLAPGTSLGRYVVSAQIGAGGMGEVYRARDNRLERDIALKILPAELTRDADRVRRFEREAKAASALNHPNILTIHDIDRHESIQYISMELIEGETLRAKITNREALGKVVEWLAQVAEALAKAHANGIVHRDLKPENIMISSDGFAKVLDFGLAKLVEDVEEAALVGSDADAETAEFTATRAGIILGTLGYMSPEQAEAKDVDHRSDIFSFGCILYEAITGRRAFKGDSQVDTIHKIIYDEPPPLETIAPATSVELQRIVRKCLAKDRERRYQNIRDVAVDLREFCGSSKSQATPRSKQKYWLGWVAGVATLVVIGIVATIAFRRTTPRDVQLPTPFASVEIERVTYHGDVSDAAISPDARYLAFVRAESASTKASLWIRDLASGAELEILRDRVPPRDLRFSPRSDALYFLRADDTDASYSNLHRISVLGGKTSQVIHDIDSRISFSPDGSRFAFVRGRELRSGPHLFEWRLITATHAGADEKVLFTTREPIDQPAWKPDGAEIFFAQLLVDGTPKIAKANVTGNERTIAFAAGSQFLPNDLEWTSDGSSLIYTRTWPRPALQPWIISAAGRDERQLVADALEYRSLSLPSSASMITAVQTSTSAGIWVVGTDGTMPATQISHPAMGRRDGITLSWPDDEIILSWSADRDLTLTSLTPAGDVRGTLFAAPFARAALGVKPALSPDGRFIVFTGVDRLLYIVNRDGSGLRRLTHASPPVEELDPVWLPDGQTVVFSRAKPFGKYFELDGVLAVNAETSASREIATGHCRLADVSPEGAQALVMCAHPGGPVDRLVTVANGEISDAPFRIPEPHGPVSWHEPDAIYYSSGGRVYRQPIRGGASAPVSTLSDVVAFEHSHDGKRLAILRQDDNLWVASPPGAPPVRVTNVGKDRIRGFAFSPDGRRIVFSRATSTSDVVFIHDRTKTLLPPAEDK